jgi:MoxR-like ATPase
VTVSSDRIREPDSAEGFREIEFTAERGVADRVHLLGVREIRAVNAAIAAGRPLLVRGEPGIGKSQLARAAAKELGRAYVKHVVDSHSESRDLMWRFDAVSRLADAQIAGALHEAPAKVRADLAVENYLHPGPLWWAFDAADAERQRGKVGAERPVQPDSGDWSRGCVFLLDEIDKAEAEVPNGLLEAMGAREFTPFGMSRPVRLEGPAPLVVITTNEERILPDAFLRRCFVLPLALPKDPTALTRRLMEFGAAHFPEANEAVLREAADMLVAERQSAIAAQETARPGQAEYLDLLRAVLGLVGDDLEGQLAMLKNVGEFTMRKQASNEDGFG